MSGAEPVRAQGATCRADLLRLLAAAPHVEDRRVALVLDVDATGWFGYERRPKPAPQPPAAAGAVVELSPGAEAAPRPAQPLRLPFLPAMVRRETRRPPERDPATEQALAHSAPIDEAAARPPSDRRLIAFKDLVPSPRLMPALRRLLGARRFGLLDVDRLTQLLAASRLPRRLPRRVFRRWHPDLIVLLDFCPRLWPYRWDMHQLAQRLSRQVGRSGVSLRVVNHGPFESWSDWLAHQGGPAAEASPPEHPWTMPPAATPVLIVSDLGMLLGPQSDAAQAWAAFVRALIRAQVRPLALVPLGAGQVGEPMPPSLPILRWSPDARPRPVRARGTAAPQPDGIDDLLAMVAATRRVDPPLLRAMRRLTPTSPLNAGLEGAVWCHADVDATHTASIRPQWRETHLRHFSDRLQDLHAELDRQRATHHAHLRAALNHEETLLWTAQVRDEAIAHSPGAGGRIDQARQFMSRLVATLTEPGQAHNWWSVAHGIVQRADGRMWQRFGDDLHRLLVPQIRAQGADAVIPEHAAPVILARLLDTGEPAVACWLVQDAAAASLVLQLEPAGPRQSPIGEALTLDAGGARAILGGQGAARWLSAAALPAQLARLGEPAELHIETAHEAIVVAPVHRPRGAGGWGCGANGLEIASPPLAGHEMRWGPGILRAVRRPAGADAPALWALAADAERHPDQSVLSCGIDAAFGVYADLHVTTEHGTALQRLRWIEPGTFLMGSPEDEPERFGDEGPQHQVTLTQGFWLADTACTQALWQVVSGTNPSDFKGADRPVERVSWKDVDGFLKKLEVLLPGCGADLPTEAEWEYACRAGTTTPFSFGAMITPEQVNYDGNYPYAGGKTGLYREETVPVNSLPPNPWGLYEMHGNVWEWCADGTRTYMPGPAVDPFGPDDEEALRATGAAPGATSPGGRAPPPASRFTRALLPTFWAFACA